MVKEVVLEGPLTKEEILKIFKNIIKKGPLLGINKPDEVPEIEFIYRNEIYNLELDFV